MTTAVDSKPVEGAPPPAAAAPAPTAKKTPKIDLTPKALEAIEKLQKKREAEGRPRALGLRIGIRGGGCTGFGYLFEWSDDPPRGSDRIFEFEGGGVKIYCDPKSLIYLDGLTLDYVTSMMGHGFKFVNPNVKSTCGCGESVQF